MITSTFSKSVRVLGVRIEPLDMALALARVTDQLKARQKGYVCLIGVHGIMESQRNPVLARVYANADMMVPDGTPTVWVGQWQGFRGMQRVAGPDLMLEIFSRPEFADYSHFLYGGKEGIAEELQQILSRRFPVGQHRWYLYSSFS